MLIDSFKAHRLSLKWLNSSLCLFFLTIVFQITFSEGNFHWKRMKYNGSWNDFLPPDCYISIWVWKQAYPFPHCFTLFWTSLKGSLKSESVRQEYWSRLLFPSLEIFLTQASYPCLLLGRWILYHWAIWEVHLKYLLKTSTLFYFIFFFN